MKQILCIIMITLLWATVVYADPFENPDVLCTISSCSTRGLIQFPDHYSCVEIYDYVNTSDYAHGGNISVIPFLELATYNMELETWSLTDEFKELLSDYLLDDDGSLIYLGDSYDNTLYPYSSWPDPTTPYPTADRDTDNEYYKEGFNAGLTCIAAFMPIGEGFNKKIIVAIKEACRQLLE